MKNPRLIITEKQAKFAKKNLFEDDNPEEVQKLREMLFSGSKETIKIALEVSASLGYDISLDVFPEYIELQKFFVTQKPAGLEDSFYSIPNIKNSQALSDWILSMSQRQSAYFANVNSNNLPQGVAILASLVDLTLSGTFRVLPPELGSLQNLQRIHIRKGMSLSDISIVSQLQNLQTFVCSNTRTSDITPFYNTNIRTLKVADSRVSKTVVIKNMPNLQSLQLNGNIGLRNLVIESAPNLIDIFIEDCDLDVLPEISHLPNLQQINIPITSRTKPQIAAYVEKNKNVNVVINRWA
jgi:hypothetical protein